MQNTRTSIAGLALCGLLAVLLLPETSWAKPTKDTYLLCKCTCRAEDELGKLHYGSANGIWYTTSGDACTLFHKCTVGRLEGIATDCLGTEHSNSVRIPPGSIQGEFQQTPSTPGAMQGPASGTILRRGVEGEQPADTAPAPSGKTNQPGETTK